MLGRGRSTGALVALSLAVGYAVVTHGGDAPDDSALSLAVLGLTAIAVAFLIFAGHHPELTFIVTPIGTGLAGYKPEQIAPLFRGAPDNVHLPSDFLEVLR